MSKKTGVLTTLDADGTEIEMYPKVITDKTLSVSGKPADAAVVGTEINELKNKTYEVITDTTLSVSGKPADAAVVGTKLTEVGTEISSLKKSVSDGKSAVASAITAKGVSTASDATFTTMANNIRSIVTDDETKFRVSLYTSLQYSGLVTSSMTFAQMCSALATRFKSDVNLLTSLSSSGWSTNNGTYCQPTFTITTSSVQYYADSLNGDITFTLLGSSPYFDISSHDYIVVSVSHSLSPKTGSAIAQAYVRMIKTDGTVKNLSNGNNNISQLSGSWRFQFVHTNLYSVTISTLTKLLLTNTP